MVIGDPNNEETTVGATITPEQAVIDLKYIQSAKDEVSLYILLLSAFPFSLWGIFYVYGCFSTPAFYHFLE